jgi:inorganic pyrophosphatase
MIGTYVARFVHMTSLIEVLIETPAGARNKYHFDETRRLLELRAALPLGMAFPFAFGFVPGTRADDGDPLDVLMLASEPLLPGCVAPARPIGVIGIKQGRVRNDRLVAVWPEDQVYGRLREYRELSARARHDIDHFFRNYPNEQGRSATLLGEHGANAARALLKASRIT